MKLHGGIVVLTVVGGLIVAYWLGQRTLDSRQAEANAAMPIDRSATTDEEIARLEAALAKTHERLARLEMQPPDPKDQVVAPAPEPASAKAPTQEQLAEQFEARAREAATEVRDESWAKQTEDRIFAAARNATPDGTKYSIESLDCRTSICKMQIKNPSLGDQDSFTQALAHQLTSQDILGSNYERLGQAPDGSFAMRVLVFRRGYPMPGVAQAE